MFFHIVNVSVRQKLIALQTNARNAKGNYFRETKLIFETEQTGKKAQIQPSSYLLF